MSKPSQLPALLLGLLCAPALPTQHTFAPDYKRALPPRPDSSLSAVLADFDRDGDTDVFVASAGPNRLLLNDGTGIFDDVSATHLPQDDQVTTRATAVDLDGDGDLDILCANRGFGVDLQDRLYLNDGSGRFVDATAARLPAANLASSLILVGDVDGDQDLDLVVARGSTAATANSLYLNDGTGRFLDASARLPSAAEPTRAAVLFDADGDGDLDLFEGNGDVRARPDRLLLNDGRGTFTDSPVPLPGSPAKTTAVLSHDFDGDGDPDVFVGTDELGGSNRLLINDGTGRFTLAPTSRFPAATVPVSGASLVDLEGDGDLDILVSDDASSSPTLYRNDGTGAFSIQSPLALPEYGRANHYLAGDVDGDGDEDLFVARSGHPFDRLLWNDGAGGFLDATALAALPELPAWTDAFHRADLDGDGSRDLAVVHEELSILLDRGFGEFSDDSDRALPAGFDRRAVHVTSGDYDADGDLDLVILRGFGLSNALLLNDGTARFVDASHRLPQLTSATLCAASGDVDGDGDLDLILGNSDFGPGYLPGKDCLLLNDGTGRFTRAGLTAYPTIDRSTFATVLHDLDADGDLDAVVQGSSVDLYVNVGAGNFRVATDSLAPALLGASFRNSALGDVDGDGDTDLWVGGAGGQSIFLNDGAGRFTERTGALPGSAQDLVMGQFVDFDGDGDLDLVSATNLSIACYTNSGNGRFTLLPIAFEVDPLANPTYFLAEDFDLDGDLDLLLSPNLEPLHFERSLTRQLSAPRPARIDRRYDLVYQGPAAASPRQVPLLMSTAPARIGLGPLGVLGIDPLTAFPLPAVTLAPGAVRGSIQLFFPNQAALVGASFFVQGLDPLAGAPRLTNRIRDVLLPR